MAVRKVLAREFLVEIEDPDSPGSYVAVGGLRTITFDDGKTDADTTTFDSLGWAEHMVAERSGTIGLQGLWLEDPDSGARDAGQEACEAAALLMGAASLVGCRLTKIGGATRDFQASVTTGGPSGGHNDPAAWSANLTRSGQPVDGS